ncbi:MULTISPECIES: hypothetical protein, partial [unclassified Tatumella]|uniref:hypothetical protein n=1 Tax=unclassified Tatumella TaxID=2649542 RepID=UPI001BB02FD1
CLAIDQIAQSGLSSLKVIYYLAQLFRLRGDGFSSGKSDAFNLSAFGKISHSSSRRPFHVGASPLDTSFEKPVPVNRQSLFVAAAYAISNNSLI